MRAAAAQLTALAASGLLLTDSDAGTTAAAAPAAGAGVADGLMQQLLDAMPAVGGVGVGGSGSSSSSSRLLEEQEGSMLAVGELALLSECQRVRVSDREFESGNEVSVNETSDSNRLYLPLRC